MASHQVAVNAYLICNREFLLLKRARVPAIWGPPGGRLKQDEDPQKGLKREVFEETGLNIDIHQPVTTWFGKFYSNPLLSIDYLCTAYRPNVVLSVEHTNYKWFALQELYKNRKSMFVSPYGFQFPDFLLAWVIYLHLNQNWQEIKDIYANRIFKKYLPSQKRFRPE
jgi:8-oxo-dGTP pyrophosphatase MutT (NUDIX family)